MGPGGWNEKYSPKAKEFYDKFLAMHGRPPGNWSAAFGYGTYQIYEQAIEKVGLKDREKLRDYIATATFDTVYGPIKYTDYFNEDHVSYIGQWQKGTFESVAPKETRKVTPIYPKPRVAISLIILPRGVYWRCILGSLRWATTRQRLLRELPKRLCRNNRS